MPILVLADSKPLTEVLAQPIATVAAALIAIAAALIAWQTAKYNRGQERQQFEDNAHIEVIDKQIEAIQQHYARFLGIGRTLHEKIILLTSNTYETDADKLEAHKEVTNELNELTYLNSLINLEEYKDDEEVAHKTHHVAGTLRELRNRPKEGATRKRYDTLGADLQDTMAAMQIHLSRLRADRDRIITTRPVSTRR